MAFFLIPLLIQLAIGVAAEVVGYLLAPKPRSSQPSEIQDMEDPTAEAGRPIPVLFGEMWIDSVNIIWFGEKATKSREIKG